MGNTSISVFPYWECGCHKSTFCHSTCRKTYKKVTFNILYPILREGQTVFEVTSEKLYMGCGHKLWIQILGIGRSVKRLHSSCYPLFFCTDIFLVSVYFENLLKQGGGGQYYGDEQ